MPDMNQPNLQAILFKYLQDHARAQAHDRLQEHNNADSKAIDAIYAGLLAEVIGEDETDFTEKTDTMSVFANHSMLTRNTLRATQRQALKRWCYGDDNDPT